MTTVNIGALEALREALSAFSAEQLAALDGAVRAMDETHDALQVALREWTREVDRCESGYQSCVVSALAAAMVGEYVDCSGQKAAWDAAIEQRGIVIDWIDRVRRAGDQWSGVAARYRAYLGEEVPAMQVGLDARVTSVENYLSWASAFGGSSGGGASARPSAGSAGATYPPGGGYDVERREGGTLGPERR